MADQDGIRGALVGALAAVEQPPSPEQLDLLEKAASQRPSAANLRFDAPALAAEVERTGRAGRPKGAQNLSTRELKTWIVQLLGGTPQERLARWAMLEPEELAKRLGCTVAEAFDRQVRILEGLGPYLMAKMVPVDEAGNAVPFIQLITGNQGGQGDGQVPWQRFLRQADDAVTVDAGAAS